MTFRTERDGAVPAVWRRLFRYRGSRVLGDGASGVARLVTLDGETCNGEEVVTKEIQLRGMNRRKLKKVMTELAIQSEVDHPNVMGLYDYTPKSESKLRNNWRVTILMAPAYGGDMHARYVGNMTAAEAATGIQPGSRRTEDETVPSPLAHNFVSEEPSKYAVRDKYVAKLICDTASGVAYLHEFGYLHRDVKPRNIWASHEECLENEQCRYILGDFGEALKIGEVEDWFSSRDIGTKDFKPPEVKGSFNLAHSILRKYHDECLNDCKGERTMAAMDGDAEETWESACKEKCRAEYSVLFEKGGWTKAGDVFSLGQTLYYTLTSEDHGDGNYMSSTYRERNMAPVQELVHKLSEPLAALINSMRASNPAERPTAAEVRDQACATANLPERPVPIAPACATHCRSLHCADDEVCSPRENVCVEER